MKEAESPMLQQGVYRHNKSGNLYEVIGVALETETDDAVVVYRPLYDHDYGYELFSRPYDSFIEVVELNGKRLPRFEYVAEN